MNICVEEKRIAACPNYCFHFIVYLVSEKSALDFHPGWVLFHLVPHKMWNKNLFLN